MDAFAALDVGAELGGDKDLVAADLGDRLANDFLGMALAIDGGGVDEVHAAVDHGANGPDRLGVVDLAVVPAEGVGTADGPGADRDGRDLL